MARPKKKIDWKELDKLCYLQCTLVEIAEWFECSVDTIERRCQEEKEMSFAEYFKLKRGAGKIALRRNQFQLSVKHPSMAIFLGKNYLNQTDKQELLHSGEISVSLADLVKQAVENDKSK